MKPSDATEDLKILKNILYKAHPSLTQYSPLETFDTTFDSLSSGIKEKDSLTVSDFFKDVLTFYPLLRDGNFQLSHPFQDRFDRHWFPVPFTIHNKQMITLIDHKGILRGSIIHKINEIPFSMIYNKLKKYSSIQGYNDDFIRRNVIENFSLYYQYEFGKAEKFSITYSTPDRNIYTKVIPSRFKLFVEKEYQQLSYSDSEPYVQFLNEKNFALLTIPTFQLEDNYFEHKIAQIFNDIEEKEIKNLVIDIRENKGGSRVNAIHLYSKIAKTPFQQRTHSFVATLEVPEKSFIKNTFFNKTEDLKAKYYPHPIADGWKFSFDDLQPLMVPHTKTFTGKVYVLISANTRGTGSDFALLAKKDPTVQLVGSEATGANYFSNNSSLPVIYELPNSRIQVILYLERNYNHITEKIENKEKGILPDIFIHTSLEAIQKNEDKVLNYVLKLTN